MTDHEARARDEISGPSTNVFADLDLPYHAKALEIVNTERCRNCRTIGDTCECEAEGGIRIAYPLSDDDLISAISSALKEAVEAEREACAKIVDGSFGRYSSLKREREILGAVASAIRSQQRVKELEEALEKQGD